MIDRRTGGSDPFEPERGGVSQWDGPRRQSVKFLRVPPPVLLATAAMAQHCLSRRRAPTLPCVVVSTPLALASGWLMGASLWEFRRCGTTVDPIHVASVRSLVMTGPNGRTRNPMYLGMAGMLLSHAALRGSLPALLPVVGFILLIDRRQIPAEETALRDAFGAQFESYRARVPRWLDRRSVKFHRG